MSWKLLFYFLLLIVTFPSASAQKKITLSTPELNNLTGCWQGTLNYSGTMIRKPYTTKASLTINRIGQAKAYTLVHAYPGNELTSDTFNISTNGSSVNGARIFSKKTTQKGKLVIVTQQTGYDNDYAQSVIIQKTYSICKNKYTYSKKIKAKDHVEWLDREGFMYERIACDK